MVYKPQYLQPICIKHKVFELLHCVLTSAARSVAMFRLERASIMAAVNSELVCSKDLRNGSTNRMRIRPKMWGALVSVARLAQSVEHETLNLRVVGSSPTSGAALFFFPFPVRF